MLHLFGQGLNYTKVSKDYKYPGIILNPVADVIFIPPLALRRNV